MCSRSSQDIKVSYKKYAPPLWADKHHNPADNVSVIATFYMAVCVCSSRDPLDLKILLERFFHVKSGHVLFTQPPTPKMSQIKTHAYHCQGRLVKERIRNGNGHPSQLWHDSNKHLKLCHNTVLFGHFQASNTFKYLYMLSFGLF